VTAAINFVAANGWRLVGVQPQFDSLSRAYGIFEREVKAK
jgi:hypothetical protein